MFMYPNNLRRAAYIPTAFAISIYADMRRFLLLFIVVVLPALAANGQDLPTIESKTEGMEKLEGFFDIYWDEEGGKLWLEIARFNEEFLYQVSLAAGLGSNDIGLDRNQLGPSWLVHFEKRGPKVLLVAPNLAYMATSDNEAERKSVTDAFASGVVFGFEVAAQTDARVLVDATSFVVRDAHGAISRLSRNNQGSFRVENSRSATYRENTKSFPENTEMEALLTFVSDSPGGTVRSVSSVAGSFTLRERHSFIKLPPPGYTPRAHDPRAGYGGRSFLDFSAPIGSDMRTRYISRHRLEKVDPTAAVSDAVEPIVYYLDAGTPEPVRSALLEGARWWNQAFEAAGYRNAFQVEMMPEDGDPLDVRYNVINWVHRSTRGWSYGSSITDPRTGEIIKGHVLLGSLRVRQDYLIAEGLLAPYDLQVVPESGDTDPMLEMALARIRQLSAHEVGHTLGIQHNFAASVDGRASVMDYPAPLAEVNSDGRVTLNRAYESGIGEWDKIVIRYGYSHFPDGLDEETALQAILDEYIRDGWHFITDTDARPAGSAHPLAHLWDNGTDVVDVLEEEMTVRKHALDRFGSGNIKPNEPMAKLEEVLVPLYLRHRYQIDAVAKLIGGVNYSYKVRGDRQDLPEPVGGRDQTKAIDALLKTVLPDALELPRQIRTLIPPRPPGYGQHRELFDGHTGLIFDPYAPAAVVAQQVFGLLMNPARTARLTYQKDFDRSLPGLQDMMLRVTDKIWLQDVPKDSYHSELQRLSQQIWTDHLLEAASSNRQASAARSRITFHLRDIHGWLSENADRVDDETRAHRFAILDEIDRYLFRPYQPQEEVRPITAPPGSPIGQDVPAWITRNETRQAWLDNWNEVTMICSYDEGF